MRSQWTYKRFKWPQHHDRRKRCSKMRLHWTHPLFLTSVIWNIKVSCDNIYSFNCLAFCKRITIKEKGVCWAREWEEKARISAVFLPVGDVSVILCSFNSVVYLQKLLSASFQSWTRSKITNTFDNNMFLLRKCLF